MRAAVLRGKKLVLGKFIRVLIFFLFLERVGRGKEEIVENFLSIKNISEDWT